MYKKNIFLRFGLVALLLLAIPVSVQLVKTNQENRSHAEVGNAISESSVTDLHKFIGSFGLIKKEHVIKAAQNGIQLTLGVASSDEVKQSLKDNNLKGIDSNMMRYVQCHACSKYNNSDEYNCSAMRCPLSNLPLDTEDQVLKAVQKYLEKQKNDSLIVGYWILDDWYFPTYEKELLKKITNLIHTITPGRKSICGFGGRIGGLPENKAIYTPEKFNNFSTEGCDMVGLYVYGDRRYSSSSGGEDRYDWTMSGLLPKMLATLKSKGWSVETTPLIGIPQIFGTNLGKGNYPVPTENGIKIQTESFCKAGATGIIYFDWDGVNRTGENMQYPWNNNEILRGINKANEACKNIWSGKSPSNPSTDSGRKLPDANKCVARIVDGVKGQCQTNNGKLPKLKTSCIVDGKAGFYEANLCSGKYNTAYRCCVPVATLDSPTPTPNQNVTCKGTCYTTKVGNPGKIPDNCSDYDNYYPGNYYKSAVGTCLGGGLCCVKKVDCTPNTQKICSGDKLLTCNTKGDNWNYQLCPNGCQDGSCK